MNTTLKLLALFSLVTDVITKAKTVGPKPIATAVLDELNTRVQTGHLPHTIKEGIEDFLPAVLNAHPMVAQSDRSHGPIITDAAFVAPKPATTTKARRK